MSSKSDFLPEGSVIWLMRTIARGVAPHYCWWFDNFELAVFQKRVREQAGVDMHGPVRFLLSSAPPEGWAVEYLLFDLANGDALTQRYCWWFPTRGAALAHKKHQRSLKYGTRLSQPVRCLRPQDQRHSG